MADFANTAPLLLEAIFARACAAPVRGPLALYTQQSNAIPPTVVAKTLLLFGGAGVRAVEEEDVETVMVVSTNSIGWWFSSSTSLFILSLRCHWFGRSMLLLLGRHVRTRNGRTQDTRNPFFISNGGFSDLKTMIGGKYSNRVKVFKNRKL